MPALLHPGKIISLARSSNPATWNDLMSADYSMQMTELLALLEQRKIPFVIVGGIALLQHVQGRNTEDIDLIISAPQLEEIPELHIQERSEMFAFCQFYDLRVDIRFAEHPVFEMVAGKFSLLMEYAVGHLPTATIDGLILLKLFALPSLYRQFNFDRIAIYEADVTQLLSRSDQTDAFFLNLLQPHLLESDCRELADILAETRSRLRRMGRLR